MKYLVTYEEKSSGKIKNHEFDESVNTNYIQMTNDESIYVVDVYRQLTYKEILDLVTKK